MYQILETGIVVFINIIIAIPVFFLLRWIYRKIIKKISIRKSVTWISTLIITPLLYIAGLYILFSVISYYPSHDFNKEKWKNDKEKRYELSEDLIAGKILIGKTKQEVIELLGKELNNTKNDSWIYDLGYSPGLIVFDPDILIIEFKDNKVIRVCL
ncbi:MAG: hypothetical protein K8R54_07450 [Bacteroidales bacterium]|nr:hypothetical protein [Bacteroidales bacterium]